MIYIRSVVLDRDAFESDSSYIRRLPLLSKFTSLDFTSPVTFITGDNGTGKSTLIEAIAVTAGFNAEGGSKNFSFSTRPSHSALTDYIKIVRGEKRERDGWFLRAESFFNVATDIESLDRQPASAPKLINSYGGRSLHEQSHGESFFALMKNRFGGGGLYLLDEPEAALSPSRQMAMLLLMKELVESNAQFIISTHSPILMAFPGASVFEASAAGLNPVQYRMTESYIVTKRFMSDPEGQIKRLFDPD